MTNRASQVLQSALTSQASTRSRRAAVYLNARARTAARNGRWLSEIGFLAATPFAYAELDPSNALPPEGPEGRAIDRVILVPYGLSRDVLRLRSNSPADRAIRTTREDGASGLAPYPDDENYLAPADLEDDTAVTAKTTALLAGMRTANGSPGYHAVITRGGAVYIAAPLDDVVAPVPGAETAVCVALEGAARKRRTARAEPETAPITPEQYASLVVLLAKVGSAYIINLAVGQGVQYAVRTEDAAANGLAPLFAPGTPLAEQLAESIIAERTYDISTEVFRRTPPEATHRAEAQAAIGHEDTMGASALLLGAYADVAAADRSDGMREMPRVRTFVERARVAHLEGDEAAVAAGGAAASERLAPVHPEVSNSEPHAYDYATGMWGDGTSS